MIWPKKDNHENTKYGKHEIKIFCVFACPVGPEDRTGWLKFSPSLNLNPALAGSIFQRSLLLLITDGP